MTTRFAASALIGVLLAGCAARTPRDQEGWSRQALRAEQITRLNLPGGEPFEASGLLRLPGGEFLTVNNRRIGLHRIEFLADGESANLVPLRDCFTPSQLSALGLKTPQRWDCEGIARDRQGRLYLSDEVNRWILRCAPGAPAAERLPIDWSPVSEFFSAIDPNASFEGIAIGGDRLFVANERSSSVIIVVDLATLKVREHFVVYPTSPSLLGTHYSDLCWWDGHLWVLLRHDRVVLEVDPRRHTILAEYDYRALEDDLGYRKRLPTGIMEGLWVDNDFIWLLTDNNNLGLAKAPSDTRPTLVKCRRPVLKRR
jgi:hypothetical protein